MNIQQLKSVLALSKKLNFTRAAEEMNIVQPAMSRQIKQLEEEIDAILFNRNKRNVQLTAAGKFFVGEVEGMLNKLDKVISGDLEQIIEELQVAENAKKMQEGLDD